jgi:hypothetical protein
MVEPEGQEHGESAMALTCESCDVRLYGREVEAGVCEHCVDKPRRPRSAPGAFLGTGGQPSVGWGTVRLGTQFLQWAAGGSLLSFLLFAVGLFTPVVLTAYQFFAPVPMLLFVAGGYLCSAVPGQSGLRVRAWVAGLTLTAYLLAVAGFAVWMFQAGDAPARGMVLLASLPVLGVAFASSVAVCVLLSGVAHQWKNASLGGKLMALPFVALAAVIAFPLVVGIGGNVLTGSPELGVLASLVASILVSVLVLAYALGLFSGLSDQLS